MTDRPDPVEPGDPDRSDEPAEPTDRPDPGEPIDPGAKTAPARRRVRRRAERPGTNPSAEDVPDVVPPRAEPEPGETQHDRWLREQRPPHWE